MKPKRMRLSTASATVAAVALVLGGCDRSSNEGRQAESSKVEPEAEPEPTPDPTPTASPAAPVETPTPEPTEEVAPDEQLQVDAEAAGMTSRVTREDEAANATER